MIDKLDAIVRLDEATDEALYYGLRPAQSRVYDKTKTLPFPKVDVIDAGELPFSALAKLVEALPEKYRTRLVDQVRRDLNRAIHKGESYLENERRRRGGLER